MRRKAVLCVRHFVDYRVSCTTYQNYSLHPANLKYKVNLFDLHHERRGKENNLSSSQSRRVGITRHRLGMPVRILPIRLCRLVLHDSASQRHSLSVRRVHQHDIYHSDQMSHYEELQPRHMRAGDRVKRENTKAAGHVRRPNHLAPIVRSYYCGYSHHRRSCRASYWVSQRILHSLSG